MREVMRTLSEWAIAMREVTRILSERASAIREVTEITKFTNEGTRSTENERRKCHCVLDSDTEQLARRPWAGAGEGGERGSQTPSESCGVCDPRSPPSPAA